MRAQLIGCGTLIVMAAMALTSESASAQAFYSSRMPQSRGATQVYRPTISPYLNLLRGDVGLAPNYQTLVRPQMQQMNYDVNQGAAIGALENTTNRLTTRRSLRGDASDIAPPTGHYSRFQDYSHYYGQLPYGAGLPASLYSAQ